MLLLESNRLNIYASRDGEVRSYTPEEPDHPKGTVYAVMLARVPPVPGMTIQNHIPFAVLCATRYWQDNLNWGWVHMDAGAKESVGSDLEKFVNDGELKPDQWIYMEVRPATLYELESLTSGLR